jgi:hypothetical protein
MTKNGFGNQLATIWRVFVEAANGYVENISFWVFSAILTGELKSASVDASTTIPSECPTPDINSD